MVMLILLMGFVVFVLGFNNKVQIDFGRTSSRSSNSTQTVNLPLSFITIHILLWKQTEEIIINKNLV